MHYWIKKIRDWAFKNKLFKYIEKQSNFFSNKIKDNFLILFSIKNLCKKNVNYIKKFF
jgi:hypothetical protein